MKLSEEEYWQLTEAKEEALIEELKRKQTRENRLVARVCAAVIASQTGRYDEDKFMPVTQRKPEELADKIAAIFGPSDQEKAALYPKP